MAGALTAFASAADAAIIFSQDFETGLTAQETITAGSPGFGRASGLPLGNGTFGVGHANGYINGNNSPLDIYSLTLDLSGASGTTLSIDYNMRTETGFDEFGFAIDNVALVATSGFVTNNEFDAVISGFGAHGAQSGTAVFDLSAFDGDASVTFQVVLAPDDSVTSQGFFIDNIVVEANRVAAVPEPATLGLLGCALLGFAATWRRRRD